MGCWDVLKYKLKKFCCNCLIVACVIVVNSCSVDNERANTSFRPVPYQQPTVRRPYPPPAQYQYRNPYYGSAPNSRSYYNPYDFQQPYGSNPYSDYDQYYVPPVEYYNEGDDDFTTSPR